MTLRNASYVQDALAVVIWLVMLPFEVCYLVFGILYLYSDKILDYAGRVIIFFGRYLFLHSDEVKDGTIHQDVLKYEETACGAYRRMKFMNKKNLKTGGYIKDEDQKGLNVSIPGLRERRCMEDLKTKIMNMKEICEFIRTTMEADNTSPDNAISALGQSLTSVLMTVCEIHNWDLSVCQATLDFLTKMHEQLQKTINEHTPKDTKFLSLDEVMERVKELSVEPKQADRNARVNACQQIMKTETLGFLLLSYLSDGYVSVYSNLHEPEKRDKVLILLREILYSNVEKKIKI